MGIYMRLLLFYRLWSWITDDQLLWKVLFVMPFLAFLFFCCYQCVVLWLSIVWIVCWEQILRYIHGCFVNLYFLMLKASLITMWHIGLSNPLPWRQVISLFGAYTSTEHTFTLGMAKMIYHTW
jgi:hypothetical protein